jgi:CheY-like chemotaxis protein
VSALRTVVADRDPDHRDLLRRALRRDPAIDVVAEAADGPGAVDAVVAEAADVLVLDADLPRLDGPGVVAAVRASHPACRCVFVTSVPAGELHAVGPVGVVPRSTPVLELAAAVRAVAAAVDAADDAAEAAMTVDADNLAPRAARRFVDDVLAAAGYGDVLDTVELLVTELVTNAVTHARSEATVLIRLLPDAVRVEVTDLDDSFPVRRIPHPDRPGGRGLELVEQMSRSWGIDMLEVGKRTWFEVERETAAV